MQKILLLEDDISLGNGIKMALQTSDIEITLCRTLAEAKTCAAKFTFDLLILDVNLPDGSGLDLLMQVRQTGSLPVILLTANDMEMDIVNGLESGADDYITKPFSLAVLRARVHTQLRRAAAIVHSSSVIEIDDFLSLTLSVVLLTITVTFTNGFDMDKYLSNFVYSDFILADAGYFQVGNSFRADMDLPQGVIDTISDQGGITEGGRVYGKTSTVQEFISEDWYRVVYGRWVDEEQLEQLIAWEEHNEDGLIADRVQLYGMERFALDKLQVQEGDITKLYEPGSRYIAAVYSVDEGSHWAKVGDKVLLRYIEEEEYYNPETGDVYEDPEAISDSEPYRIRAKVYQDVEYEVAALVKVPHPLSYRYYGADEFVMNAETFVSDTGTDHVMYYAFDAAEEAVSDMEHFLADYTGNKNPAYDYESRGTYEAEFESFRTMFLMLGGVLSFIVGLVGILNFFNAILTGIIARKREFAVMQSIGMTGKQLKQMLVCEGLIYAIASLISTFVLIVVLGPVIANVLQDMFWFFTYKFTVTPILIVAPGFILLGCVVPLLVYKKAARATVVERLREAEN